MKKKLPYYLLPFLFISLNSLGQINFAAKVDYAAISSTRDLKVADFNSDGILDIAISGGTGQFGIFTGTGTGTFGTLKSFGSVVSNPISIAVGDFNKDGFNDVAIPSNSSSSTAIFTGTGTGSFNYVNFYSLANGAYEITTDDFNGDGNIDIMAATASSGGSIALLTGTGTGSFGSVRNYTASYASGLAIGDFNGDGLKDIVTNRSIGGGVDVLLKNLTTGFDFPVFSSAGNGKRVEVGDFNKDGYLDAAITIGTGIGTISILTGTGTGDLALAYSNTVGNDPIGIVAADFNGDGNLDLSVANQNDNTVHVLQGNGDGSFQPLLTLTSGLVPTQIVSADLNGDGKPDLITSNSLSSISVFINTSTFSNLVTSATVSGQGGVSTISTSGASLQMISTYAPSNATNSIAGWSVFPTSVATISGTGLLKAIKNGVVTVTGSYGSVSASATIIISGQPINSIFKQLGSKLVATGAVGSDVELGESVSISTDGKTAAVGGYKDNSGQGAVWIYTFDGTNFVQFGSKLVGTGGVGASQQGGSVSISADGKTVLVGASPDNSSQGAAWVFTFNGSAFVQVGNKLLANDAIGNAGQGARVSISADGKTALVGGPFDNGIQGAAWVYTFDGTDFVQLGTKLVGTGNVGASEQGWSVSLSGDGKTALVGALKDNSYTGAVWIYTFNGTTFNQAGNKLVASGSVINDNQGTSVCLSSDGKTALVGGFSGVGGAWVYTLNGANFQQVGTRLIGTNAVGYSNQAWSVSLSADGKTALVGGYKDNSFEGAFWVYTFNGTTFDQAGDKVIGTGAIGSAQQGRWVSISGDAKTAIVGGKADNSNAGAIWVFQNANINPVTSATVSGQGGVSSVFNGNTLQMVSTYLPTNAINTIIGWSVSPAGIASINSSGLLSTFGTGVATVTGTYGSVSDFTLITITNNTIPVTSATISGTGGVSLLDIGGTLQMIYAYSPSNANTNTTPIWNSTNGSIASINNTGRVNAISAGVVTISGFFGLVESYYTITVMSPPPVKEDQTVTFYPLPSNITYGDAVIFLNATVNSGLTITFGSSDPNIAMVTDDILTIKGAGTARITASVGGNAFYNPSNVAVQTITVGKAQLTVIGVNASRTYGQPLTRSFIYQISGLLNGDSFNVIDTLPQGSSPATLVSDAGTYPITFTGAKDNSYSFVYINNGLLTVLKAPQTLTGFPGRARIKPGETITLSGFAPSNLPVTVSVADSSIGVANGLAITALAEGTTTLTLIQNGSNNYLPSPPLNIIFLSTTAGVIPAITFGIIGKSTVSAGSTVTYQIVQKPGYTYHWSYSGEGVVLLDTIGSQIEVLFTNNATPGSISARILDPDGNMIKLDFLTITITNDPVAGLDKDLKDVICDPLVTDCELNYINFFSIGKLLNDNSGCSKSGHGDFTASGKIDTLLMGNSYTIKITSVAEAESYFAIWIDYNNNGSFNDPDDFLNSTSESATSVEIRNTIIRNQREYNGPRRLRVAMRTTKKFDNDGKSSCLSELEKGETEDYLVFVKSLDALEASGIITPNEDGKNDIFLVRGIDPKVDNKLTILDRWGTVKYEKVNYENDWKGDNLRDGTYYYFFTNGERQIKGFVEFKRD